MSSSTFAFDSEVATITGEEEKGRESEREGERGRERRSVNKEACNDK